MDTLGLPHALHITRASMTDRDGAVEMISLNLDPLSTIKKYLVDGGYSGNKFAGRVKDLCGAEVEVVERNEPHCFKILLERWIVERSSGWLEKYRRLWKNCERKLHTSLQMTVLAFIFIILRRF